MFPEVGTLVPKYIGYTPLILLCIFFLFCSVTNKRTIISSSYNKTLHVSDSSSVHHQEFFTVHAAMVYVIQVC